MKIFAYSKLPYLDLHIYTDEFKHKLALHSVDKLNVFGVISHCIYTFECSAFKSFYCTVYANTLKCKHFYTKYI